MELKPAEIALVAVGFLLLVVLLWALRIRRNTNRRLKALAARMSEEGFELEGKGGLEKTLSQLERATSTAMARVGDAHQAEQRLKLALGGLAHGVVVCDDQGEVVFRNGHADEVLGGESSDVLAQDSVKRLLKGAVEGHPGSETIELYGPPRRTLAVSAHPLETDWRSIGAVAVIEDVSERRRLEVVRRDFVANMSHELKTPVGALWLLAETLGSEEDPDVMYRLASRIQNEAARVGRIMDDLLDLTRIESEETPTREPVPVHLVVAQAAERVRAAAEQRKIRIRIGEPPHHLSVLGDRRQLISALYNLMENAVKYSADGSTVEVGGRTDGKWVELRVRDRGIGIPGHDLERIFERFYRVDRGAKDRKSAGTGLGLAIVRHVASNHGGEVLVESTEGSGSTFTLRLPLSPTALAANPA